MFDFKSLDYLTDKEIDLVLEFKLPEIRKKGYVPTYKYIIKHHGLGDIVGRIDIRIGENENTYYGGNIGYEIYEPFRGNNYAEKACKIIRQVALAHEMRRLIITCNPDNLPSRRTCEKLGLKLLQTVDLPSYSEMYFEGERQKCIFEWVLSEAK